MYDSASLVVGLVSDDDKLTDLAVSMLTRIHQFRAINFYDKIRLTMFRLNPYIATAGMNLQSIVGKFGWPEAIKKFAEVKELLERADCEMGRACFNQAFWLELSLDYIFEQEKEHGPRDWVVFPVKHTEEANSIAEFGGCIIRVTTPKLNNLAQYSEEFWDKSLLFSGNKEDFYTQIMTTINQFKLQEP